MILQYNMITKIKCGLPELGSRWKNNQGKWFTVVSVDGCKRITIKFDERGIIKVTTSHYVRTGCVKLPSYVVGDILQDKFGEKVKIVKIEGVSKITFEWPDGYKRTCQSSVLLSKTGLIRESESQRLNPQVKVGQFYKTTQGCEVEVVEYANSLEIWVEFKVPNKFRVKTTQGNLKRGSIYNKHLPTVFGIGTVGNSTVSKKDKVYTTWAGMLSRCYNPRKSPTGNRTYLGCSVDVSWHSLENYEKWYNQQIKLDGWHLDKDLLQRGNKIYSQDSCVFLPRELNTFLTDRRNFRGEYPVGVTYHKRLDKFQATCSTGGHKISEYLGIYDTPEEAFQVYKTRKENYAKELAEKWKDIIDYRAYIALLNYRVLITG